MKYFRFKTFTTSYYFPRLTASQRYMYGLYSAYGGRLSKAYWWLFRHCGLVRSLNVVKEADLDFPYAEIKAADGTDSLMAFNMGSPGVEQKISILGYDNAQGAPFFAKFSEKPQAMELTRNEVRVYRALDGTGLTPQLLGVKEQDDFVYMKAAYVRGNRPKERGLTPEILELCIALKDYHLDASSESQDGGLKTSLSHGDFCPWNVLVDGSHWRLIDWELAAERPLGYDLFTYICQVAILFSPDVPLNSVLRENKKAIKRYFDACEVDDYLPYLRKFAESKWKYETQKGNSRLTEMYKNLFEDLRFSTQIDL